MESPPWYYLGAILVVLAVLATECLRPAIAVAAPLEPVMVDPGGGFGEVQPLPSVEESTLEPVGVCTTCPPVCGESKYPTVKLGGFFQADVGWFAQDAASIAAVGDVQDGADFRRARLNAGGEAAENIHYFMEFDFAFPGRPSFMDVYMDLREFFGPGTSRLGYWRQPIGMDALTSVKELTFLERALPFAFLPFRQIGVGKFNGSEDGVGTWAASVIRFPTDFYGGNIGDDGGYGVVGRLTRIFLESDDGERLVHVGGGYTFADPANNRVQYQSQPEFSVSETGGAALVPPGVPNSVPPFVNTGPIAANNFQLFGGELAMLYNSLYMQSEVIYARVNQIGGPTAHFWGAYAQMGYFLTGEVRPYNHKNGVFGRVVPLDPFSTCGGIGAWEVAARWSAIDLDDDGISGGRLNDLTFGLNWYLTGNVRCQFNYIHAFLNTAGIGDSNTGILAARAQVVF